MIQLGNNDDLMENCWGEKKRNIARNVVRNVRK